MVKKSIEYSDLSTNPYTGCRNFKLGNCALGEDCWFVVMANRLKGRYGYDKDDPCKPTFHPDRLNEPLKRKKPARYAMCFMGDICYCKPKWMDQILEVIKQCPQHRFYFLTKAPAIFMHRIFPDNVWFGTTVNLNSEVHRINYLKTIKAGALWISFEPPYNIIDADLSNIDWVVIGAKTGKHPYQPDKEIVNHLIKVSNKHGIPIFMKNNLIWNPLIQQFPNGGDW